MANENPDARQQADVRRKALLDAVVRGHATLTADKNTHTPLHPVWSMEQETLWRRTKAVGEVEDNLHSLVRLTGPLNLTALEQAFREITARHETLRASFHDDGAEVRIGINQDPRVRFILEDLTSHSLQEDAMDAALRHSGEMAKQAFAPSKAPLASVVIYRIASEDHLLMILADHLICDGWSYGIMLLELSELYSADGLKEPTALEPIEPSYFKLSGINREGATGSKKANALNFWEAHLRGDPATPPLPAPTPKTRGDGKIKSFRSRFSSFSRRDLESLSSKMGVTPFVVLLGGLGLLIAHGTGLYDFVVKSVSAGRSDPSSQRLIGIFTRPLLLRIMLHPQEQFSGYLQRTFSMCNSVYAQESGPGAIEIADALIERGTWGKELTPNFSFLYQSFPIPDLKLDGVKSELLKLHFGNSGHVLEMYAFPNGDRLDISFEYNDTVYDPEGLKEILIKLEEILYLTTDRDMTLAEIFSISSRKHN